MKSPALLAAALAVAAAVTTIAATSYAMSGRPSSSAPRPGGDRYQCFDPNQVRGFQTISDNKMIITSDWNQAYEIQLGGVCIGLDTSFMVGIRSRSGMDVCGPFDADIIYNDMGGIRHVQSCPITSVRHLTGDEAAPYVVQRGSRSGSR